MKKTFVGVITGAVETHATRVMRFCFFRRILVPAISTFLRFKKITFKYSVFQERRINDFIPDHVFY